MGGVMNGCILPSVRTSSLRRLCPLLVATGSEQKTAHRRAVDSAGQAVWLGILAARMGMLLLSAGEERRQRKYYHRGRIPPIGCGPSFLCALKQICGV